MKVTWKRWSSYALNVNSFCGGGMVILTLDMEAERSYQPNSDPGTIRRRIRLQMMRLL